MSKKSRKRTAQHVAGKSSASKAKAVRPQRHIAAAPPYSYVDLIVVAGLLGLVGFVYAGIRHNGFISLDDPQYVSANANVAAGLTAASIKWAFSSAQFYWHPLTWISHMTDVELFGMNPGSQHLVNAVIHSLNSVLVFLVMRRMTSAVERSAWVAALFAIHPLHVESVAWIAERKDVLSAFFWLATTYAYVRFVEDRSRSKMVITVLLFTLGLLSKPMLVTFPFALLLLDYWPLRREELHGENLLRGAGTLIREKAVLFVLAFASIAVTLTSQKGTGATIALEALSVTDRIANGVVSFAMYLRDFFWPANLAPFYPLEVPQLGLVAASIIVVAGISAIAVKYIRAQPWLFTGWLWFLGTLVPVIGLVQAGDQARADRFLYIPMLGICWAIVWTAASAIRRMPEQKPARWIIRIIAATAVVMLSITARRQTTFWKDDLTLWERTVSVTKGNYRAENLYGVALTDRGRTDEGIRHYQESIRIWNENPEAHNNLGAARMDQSNYVEAVKEFEWAVKTRPGNAMYRYNLAVALDAAGRRDDAVKEVVAGLRIDPASSSLRKAADVFGVKVPQ